jgi:hypothetical protein
MLLNEPSGYEESLGTAGGIVSGPLRFASISTPIW